MAEEVNGSVKIRKVVDAEILGDNILDIADFAVEKYEFRNNTTLSDEARAAATESARKALWNMVGELRLRRKQILQAMFDKADEAVAGAVETPKN